MSAPNGVRNVIHTYHATCTQIRPQPSKTMLNSGLWWAGAQQTHMRQSNRDSPTQTLTHTATPPTHPFLLSDLSFPFTHSHPIRPAPSLQKKKKKTQPPPQLQEIPNDLHHHCACSISCQEPARPCTRARTHTTNTHTKHINELRATHKPYVQRSKKADRHLDRQTHI